MISSAARKGPLYYKCEQKRLELIAEKRKQEAILRAIEAQIIVDQAVASAELKTKMAAVASTPVNQVPDELLNASNYNRKYPTVSEIMSRVSQEFNISINDILSERRSHDIIFARHAVFWLCRECTPLSLLQIGSLTGKRDHTTILNGINKTKERINQSMEIDEFSTEKCLRLRDKLSVPPPKPYWGA